MGGPGTFYHIHDIKGRHEVQTRLNCSLDPRPFWLYKEESGLAQECHERWNAAVSVDEGNNTTSANQHLNSTNDR